MVRRAVTLGTTLSPHPGVPVPSRPRVRLNDHSCVVDACSIAGWAQLLRENPTSWRAALCGGAPPLSGRPVEVTLGEALRCGGFGFLLPVAHQAPATLRKRRASAGRIARSLGRARIASLDEAALAALREGYLIERRATLCSQLLAEDLRLLRHVVCRGQRKLGLPVRVAYRWPPRRHRLGRKVVRPVPLPGEVGRLLEALCDRKARVIVGLAAGCGLLEIESLRLRADHLALANKQLRFPVQGVRGRPGTTGERVVPLPAWVVDLILDAFPTVLGWPGQRLLFPHRDDPTRPRTSFRRTLRRAAERARVTCWKTTDLRRLYQRAGRGANAARCVVRGTDVHTSRGRLSAVVRQRVWMAERWRQLGAPPPGFWSARRHVPRRASSGLDALSPETTRARAGAARGDRAPPLPPSCHVEAVRYRSLEVAPACTEGAPYEVLADPRRGLTPTREVAPRGATQGATDADLIGCGVLGMIAGVFVGEHFRDSDG